MLAGRRLAELNRRLVALGIQPLREPPPMIVRSDREFRRAQEEAAGRGMLVRTFPMKGARIR